MRVHTLRVRGRAVECDDLALVQGTVGQDCLALELDEEWTGLAVTVAFVSDSERRTPAKNHDGTYTVRPNQKGKGKPAHGPNRTAAPAGRQPSPGARFAPHSAPGHKPKKNQQKENTSWKTGTKKK